MIILTIRTDQAESELGLYDGQTCIEKFSWPAHRQLAETIHASAKTLLSRHGKSFRDIEAVACYAGPGSFTGLRIGMSVANALGYSLGVPLVAAGHADDWPATALMKLAADGNDEIGQVEYNADPYVTAPKK